MQLKDWEEPELFDEDEDDDEDEDGDGWEDELCPFCGNPLEDCECQ
jgi:hypothetical protein